MIYLIACDASGAMKVGFSETSPDSRLGSLQIGNPHPLRLVAVRAGDRGLEAEMHCRLAKYRMQGEWFVMNDASLDVLHDAGMFDAESNVMHVAFPDPSAEKAARKVLRKSRAAKILEAERAHEQEEYDEAAEIVRETMPDAVRDCRWLKSEQAAEILGLSVEVLKNMRRSGKGPWFAKLGGGVRYHTMDLHVWMVLQRRAPREKCS